MFQVDDKFGLADLTNPLTIFGTFPRPYFKVRSCIDRIVQSHSLELSSACRYTDGQTATARAMFLKVFKKSKKDAAPPASTPNYGNRLGIPPSEAPATSEQRHS